MIKLLIAATAILAFSATPLQSEISQGEKLEREMWEDMKHRNFSGVESKIADQFQSVHSFGALTRGGEIQLIKDLYLGSYEISDVMVTENSDTLVITYMISVREKIDSQFLSEKASPRLSVWKKIDNEWKWIAHANLKEIPEQKPKKVQEAAK